MDIYQIRGILLLISTFLNLVFALVLWFKGKSKVTFYLGLVALFSAIGTFTYSGEMLFANKLFWTRASWLGILTPPAYISFVYHFSEKTKYINLKSFFWFFWAIIFSILALTTPYVIKSVPSVVPVTAGLEQGFLRPFGRIYIIICILVAFYSLLKEYSKSRGFRKEQIKYFILGFGIYSVVGVFAVGIMPLFFPKFDLIDISGIASVIWIGLTAYAIFKKQLFKIKLVLTEILVFLIGIILLVQIFLAETLGEKIFELVLFLLFSLIGYLLIKTTYQDIKRKEEAEQLSKGLKELTGTLEKRVKQRTAELEKSYKELKERTKEIEKRKEELERFHELTVGRELEMVNLKKKVKELEKEIEKFK